LEDTSRSAHSAYGMATRQHARKKSEAERRGARAQEGVRSGGRQEGVRSLSAIQSGATRLRTRRLVHSMSRSSVLGVRGRSSHSRQRTTWLTPFIPRIDTHINVAVQPAPARKGRRPSLTKGKSGFIMSLGDMPSSGAELRTDRTRGTAPLGTAHAPTHERKAMRSGRLHGLRFVTDINASNCAAPHPGSLSMKKEPWPARVAGPLPEVPEGRGGWVCAQGNLLYVGCVTRKRGGGGVARCRHAHSFTNCTLTDLHLSLCKP
jgi:hypothetical protein